MREVALLKTAQNVEAAVSGITVAATPVVTPKSEILRMVGFTPLVDAAAPATWAKFPKEAPARTDTPEEQVAALFGPADKIVAVEASIAAYTGHLVSATTAAEENLIRAFKAMIAQDEEILQGLKKNAGGTQCMAQLRVKEAALINKETKRVAQHLK